MIEPDITHFETAALFAMEAVIHLDFSEDFLRKAIAMLPTPEVKQAEFKLAAEVRTRLSTPQPYAVLASIDSRYPKAVMEREPNLLAYRDDVRRLADLTRRTLAPEALEWAQTQLNSNPEFAALLCSTDAAWTWMSHGIDFLYCGANSVGRKKLDRHADRFFRRLDSKMPKIISAIKKADCANDRDACMAVVVQELFGSLRPLMLFALALIYGYYILLGLLLFGGCSVYLLEATVDSTLIDEPEFRDSVLAHSAILPELGPLGRLLVDYDFDTVCTVSEIIAYHRGASVLMGTTMQALLDDHRRQERTWARTEKSMNRTIEQQAKSLTTLQKGTGDAATQSLLAELAKLKAENIRLQDQLLRKDDLIARLKGPGAAVSSYPIADPATALRASQPPAPPPAAALSIDDALAYLNELKGVVVGGHPTFHAKLAQSLPHWSLHDADQSHVDDALVRGADLVVFFTNHCSHTLTQSVLKSTRQHQIPVAYAYKVNPAAFYVEVAKQAQRHKPSAAVNLI